GQVRYSPLVRVTPAPGPMRPIITAANGLLVVQWQQPVSHLRVTDAVGRVLWQRDIRQSTGVLQLPLTQRQTLLWVQYGQADEARVQKVWVP
ncbi:MAG TPA: hypothetical protein PKD90_13025, partial [Phnomibacter sp.]|nr:hypothetical protein [Phnomibacter sp.]